MKYPVPITPTRQLALFAFLSFALYGCSNPPPQQQMAPVSIQQTTSGFEKVSLNQAKTTESKQTASSTAATEKQPIPFEQWQQQLLTDAQQQGIRHTTLQQIRPYLRLNEKIIRLDQQQPEFTQTFWTYVDARLSEIRVQAGKVQAYRQKSLLQQVEQQHGVPSQILASFWGLETNYGTYLGNFNAIEALTTLAYDPRRSNFFRKELLAAMHIIDQGHVRVDKMNSSWAGAIGQMQFMPSVFLKHATDADQDGKADLWNSTEDALTSAAIYLRAAGWQPNQPWLQEVSLPNQFNYALADGKQQFSREDVAVMGVKPLNNAWLGHPNDQISLVLPAGYEGPAFVVWPNFNVIKRWNNSVNYALSVSLLAQRLNGEAGLSMSKPANAKAWAKSFIVEIQQTLTDKGYDTGGVDGWFGSKSMQALRRFQQDQQLPADGYPNATSLQRLGIAQ